MASKTKNGKPSTRREQRDRLAVQIGRRIRRVRGDRTFAGFARALGVHRGNIVHYETGKNLPGAAILCRLAKAEKVDLNWLLTGRPAPPPGTPPTFKG